MRHRGCQFRMARKQREGHNEYRAQKVGKWQGEGKGALTTEGALRVKGSC